MRGVVSVGAHVNLCLPIEFTDARLQVLTAMKIQITVKTSRLVSRKAST
jgi:hypothetical protein